MPGFHRRRADLDWRRLGQRRCVGRGSGSGGRGQSKWCSAKGNCTNECGSANMLVVHRMSPVGGPSSPDDRWRAITLRPPPAAHAAPHALAAASPDATLPGGKGEQCQPVNVTAPYARVSGGTWPTAVLQVPVLSVRFHISPCVVCPVIRDERAHAARRNHFVSSGPAGGDWPSRVSNVACCSSIVSAMASTSSWRSHAFVCNWVSANPDTSPG